MTEQKEIIMDGESFQKDVLEDILKEMQRKIFDLEAQAIRSESNMNLNQGYGDLSRRDAIRRIVTSGRIGCMRNGDTVSLHLSAPGEYTGMFAVSKVAGTNRDININAGTVEYKAKGFSEQAAETDFTCDGVEDEGWVWLEVDMTSDTFSASYETSDSLPDYEVGVKAIPILYYKVTGSNIRSLVQAQYGAVDLSWRL